MIPFGQLLDRFQGTKALVVGDLMLDEYIFGRAARISPEAPVMVVRQQSTSRLPGGAANVARNLRALGAEVTMLGVIGADEGGDLLRQSLQEQGLTHDALIGDPSRVTTRKTRVLADHAHQVLRIDHEDTDALSSTIEAELLQKLEEALPQSGVVILSDYLKGSLPPSVAQRAITLGRSLGIPVVANAKPQSLPQYKGAALLSFNRLEAREALGMWGELPDERAEEAGRELCEKYNLTHCLVTLGESGMVAVGTETFRVGVPKVEVYDTAGAGDTVIATVALGLQAAGFCHEVFELAAQTASCVVRHVGVATPSEGDLKTIRSLGL